jgi:predicted amidohydrolase
MSTFRIALLQMTPAADQAAAESKGADYCRRAKALGADMALFPEMWNIGYRSFTPEGAVYGDIWRSPEAWARDPRPEIAGALDEARAAWRAQAVSSDGAYVRAFRALARELEMAVAVTYLQAWPGAPRNAVSLIDRRGEIVFTYAKVHTCDFDHLEAACTPGEEFCVADLDTAAGPVRVGAMICFDREFPESARVLMVKGAEVILIPNACEMEMNRLGQLRVRAFENMLGVALANYAGPRDKGHSVAYDPVAFADGVSRDTTVVQAGEAEGVYLAEFDLEALRAYRAREAWGDAFRRPHRYQALTRAEVQPPFQRFDQSGAPYPRTRR